MSDLTEDTSENINLGSFGLGSFLFSIKSTKSLNYRQCTEIIVKELSQVPGLSELIVDVEDDIASLTPDLDELGHVGVKFKLDLSADPVFRDTSPEANNKFFCVSEPQFDYPVTLVYSPEQQKQPSDGIFRVREYLRRYLNGSLRLDVIGPTPFHADFFLIKAPVFSVQKNSTRGYDYINIFTMGATLEEGIKEFLDKMGQELNLYYLVCKLRNIRFDRWEDISKALVEMEKTSEKSWVRKLWANRPGNSDFNNLIKALVNYKIEVVESTEIISNRALDVYRPGVDVFIRTYVKNAQESLPKFPIKTVKELLDYKTLQVNGIYQNITQILAALFGAGAGVILTLLFEK